MRKYFKGLLVFIAVMALMLNGNHEYVSDALHYIPSACRGTASSVYHLVKGSDSMKDFMINMGGIHDEFKSLTDRTWNEEELEYHADLMDLNSLYLRYSGRDVLKKDDTTVVRLSTGQIINTCPEVSEKELKKSAEKVDELYQYCKARDVDFLYVACPTKGLRSEFPAGIENYYKPNAAHFYDDLQKLQIPNLILADAMDAEGIDEKDAYFNTDHHWLPETALWAVGKTLEAREALYQVPFDRAKSDPANFDVKVYEDWFLGAHGKKTGAYFTESGPDDIDLLIPKFETSFTEEQPLRGEVKNGSFIDTAICMENLEEKDWYKYNPYAAYSGGDFRLQILRNHLADNDQKVLLIRDSFGCAFAPFLSLQYAETYITDIRSGSWYIGDKQNIYKLIDEIQPDCVYIVYNDVPLASSGGTLNFD